METTVYMAVRERILLFGERRDRPFAGGNGVNVHDAGAAIAGLAIEIYFTDHDRDLVFGGDTYLASAGYTRSAIANEAELAVDNLDVEDVFDHEQISEPELRAGLFDHAEAQVFLVAGDDGPAGGIAAIETGIDQGQCARPSS